MAGQESSSADEAIRKVIEQYESKRLQQLADVSRTERMINELLSDLGEPTKYSSALDQSASAGGGGRKKRSRYYGKPLATAVRMYLDTLEEQPASPAEILAELEAGDFDFDAMNWQKEGRLRSLAMSLSKNTTTFHRLPSGAFGLVDWYPNAKARVKVISLKSTPADDSAEAESGAGGGEK
jgi:hypothetical protein